MGHILRSQIDQNADKAYLIGCDLSREYLNRTKSYSPYDDLMICDIKHMPFRSKCCDVIFAFEVIEHLEKNECYDFFEMLTKICKGKIIISTPRGYFPQGVVRDNKFEEHKSSWTANDFKKHGYTTQERGFGVDIEHIMRKYSIDYLYKPISKYIFKGEWNGIMLIAQKNILQEAPNE